jgi:threonine dehydrogenase-like Zn-dependent dehydrogenase
MKSWKITKPKNIELASVSDTIFDPKFVKVKILRAGISNIDINIYRGDIKGVSYPVAPARQGTGIISEILENDKGLSKSDRVYISPYISCGECLPCLSGKPQLCENMQIFGKHRDGLLADFAIVPISNLYKLPDAVDKEKVMFIDYIALSKAALDKLKISKGEHIVIIGAGKLGNILSQLTMYYQAVPILVDDDDERLELSKKSGVYYTVNIKKQDALRFIKEVTGGRMTENVVHISNSSIPVDDSLELAGMGSRIAIIGNENNALKADFNTVLFKQLSVVGVNTGYDNIYTAINLLANKTIDTANLVEQTIGFDDVPKLFKTLSEQKTMHFQIIVEC